MPVPPVEQHGAGTAFSSSLWILTDEQSAVHAQACNEVAASATSVWRDYAGELETMRDALLGRLRSELGPGFHVPTPPRLG